MNPQLKYILPILLYSIGSHAFDPCYDYSVRTDSPPYRFETKFNALFFKPTASNIYYAAAAIRETAPTISPQWNIFDLHPGYHFGFDLGGRFIFHCLNTNLMANWVRFKSSSSDFQQVSSPSFVGPFFEIGPDSAIYQKTAGNVTFSFNQFNLDYGQFVSFGDWLNVNLFAGVGFARIKQNLLATFSDLADTTIRVIQTPIRFTGAGPQFGTDFTYCIGCGFGLEGKAQCTLFAGKLKNVPKSTSLSPQTGGIVIPPPQPTPIPGNIASVAPALEELNGSSPNIQNITVQHRSQLIPAFEGSLGISYEYVWCNYYTVRFETGYQAKIYLNALQAVTVASQLTTFPFPAQTAVFARTFQRILSNFALSGPYVGLSVDF